MTQLTTFTQSKLLKEKRYVEPTLNYFMGSGAELNAPFGYAENFNRESVSKEMYSRPSLYEVLDWAREKHGLHGYTLIENKRWYNDIVVLATERWFTVEGDFDSHPEALSALVDEILTLIP